MTGFLIAIALLVAAVGVLFLSEATSGVGMIAFACLLGIIARIAQASDHRAKATAKPKPLPTDQAEAKPHDPTRLRLEW